MAKTKKMKKRRKMGLIRFSFTLMLFAIFSFLCSSLFLRSYNNSLSTETQKIEAEIAALETENDAVAVEVNTLNNRDRVNSIAEDEGLSLDESNIVTITQSQGD